MNVKDILKNPVTETPKASSFWLRQITGWALIISAIGVFMDEMMCGGCADGSIGLILLYLGFVVGSLSFIILLNKVIGWIPALVAGLGVAGMMVFMFSYPSGAEGWIGAVLIGVAHLFLPVSGRFASIFWIAAGILGFPEFHAGTWGIISAFTLFGTATAATGLFTLFGLSSAPRAEDNAPSSNAGTTVRS